MPEVVSVFHIWGGELKEHSGLLEMEAFPLPVIPPASLGRSCNVRLCRPGLISC